MLYYTHYHGNCLRFNDTIYLVGIRFDTRIRHRAEVMLETVYFQMHYPFVMAEEEKEAGGEGKEEEEKKIKIAGSP